MELCASVLQGTITLPRSIAHAQHLPQAISFFSIHLFVEDLYGYGDFADPLVSGVFTVSSNMTEQQLLAAQAVNYAVA